MRKILVVNGPHYSNALEGLAGFATSTEKFLADPSSYDMVLFTGGADVGPELYNDTSPKRICGVNPSRDAEEVKVFNAALKAGIKMTGICRGSQFLNVMSGGRMMHDVTNHAGSRHKILTSDGQELIVNSLHHQMSVPSEFGHVLAWSKHLISTRYIGKADEVEEYTGKEIESMYYPHTKSVGAQWHPEMMNKDEAGYTWYRTLVEDFLELSTEDFEIKYVRNNQKVKSASS